MKFRLVVEDIYGPAFITRFFKKKFNEGLLFGKLEGVASCSIDNKLRRKVNASFTDADRVIVLMDADGQPHSKKTEIIKQYLGHKHLDRVRIVLLDHEIEEWICYSEGIPIRGEKPSKILKHHQNYQKRHLPGYAEKLDCKKLADCPSFLRLTCALKSA